MTKKIKKKEVIAELKRLTKENGGILHEEQVVDAAKPKKSVLHKYFTWNNTEAAELWRLAEARELIRITLTVEEGKETRLFVSLSSDRNYGGGYREIGPVLNDEERRKTLLQDALYDLQVLEDKYSTLKELVKVFQEVRLVRKKLSGKKKKKKK